MPENVKKKKKSKNHPQWWMYVKGHSSQMKEFPMAKAEMISPNKTKTVILDYYSGITLV